jgi:hypothetical protein
VAGEKLHSAPHSGAASAKAPSVVIGDADWWTSYRPAGGGKGPSPEGAEKRSSISEADTDRADKSVTRPGTCEIT